MVRTRGDARRSVEELAEEAWLVYREVMHLRWAVEMKRRVDVVKEWIVARFEREGAISAGFMHSMARLEAGGVKLQGRNNEGQAPPASYPGDALKLSGGRMHTVVMRPDRSVSFFGNNYQNQAPPAGLPGPFVDVSGGDDFSILARVDGHADCIGFNTYVPPGGVAGPFVSVSAGETFAMGLSKRGKLEFWGLVGGHGQPPAGTAPGVFKAVSAGYYHVLALRFDGSARAFGSFDLDGEEPAEGRAGPFRQVAAGGEGRFVGLRVDGTLEAWGGDNNRGQLNVPAGNQWVAISAGYDFGLALHEDGTVVGWGNNNRGQTNTIEGAKRFPAQQQ